MADDYHIPRGISLNGLAVRNVVRAITSPDPHGVGLPSLVAAFRGTASV
jgi:hypothetical protein